MNDPASYRSSEGGVTISNFTTAVSLKKHNLAKQQQLLIMDAGAFNSVVVGGQTTALLVTL